MDWKSLFVSESRLVKWDGKKPEWKEWRVATFIPSWLGKMSLECKLLENLDHTLCASAWHIYHVGATAWQLNCWVKILINRSFTLKSILNVTSFVKPSMALFLALQENVIPLFSAFLLQLLHYHLVICLVHHWAHYEHFENRSHLINTWIFKHLAQCYMFIELYWTNY